MKKTILTYLGVIWLVVAWLVIAWLIYNDSFFEKEKNLRITQAVLLGLPFIAFIIISIINFRDKYGRLFHFEKVRIVKLYVAMASFFLLLLALYKMGDGDQKTETPNIAHIDSAIDSVTVTVPLKGRIKISEKDAKDFPVALKAHIVRVTVKDSIVTLKGRIDTSEPKALSNDTLGFIQAVLFILLCIAAITASTINFRDEDGKLASFKKVRIPKLYVAIGLFFILLIVLYGVTDIKHDRIFFQNFLGILKIVLFVVLGFCLLIASTINFRDEYGKFVLFEKAGIPKLYVAIGLLFIPLIVLYGITAIKYDKTFSNINNFNTIQAVLFALLTLATITLSTINFREQDGTLALFKKVKIPKLYVAIGCVLFFLLVPYGVIFIHMEEVSAGERSKILDDVQNSTATLKARIDTSTKRLNTRLDSVKDSLETRIESTETVLKARIDTSTKRLNTRLDSVKDSLETRIESTETVLKARIDTSTKRLNTRLDSVKDSLETRIESTETVLKDSIATSTKRLNTRLNSVKDSLRADIESTETVLKDSITTSATRLNTRLNSVKDSLNSVNRKVQTASESVASLSAKIDALMALNTRIDSLLKAGKNTTDQ